MAVIDQRKINSCMIPPLPSSLVSGGNHAAVTETIHRCHITPNKIIRRRAGSGAGTLHKSTCGQYLNFQNKSCGSGFL